MDAAFGVTIALMTALAPFAVAYGVVKVARTLMARDRYGTAHLALSPAVAAGAAGTWLLVESNSQPGLEGLGTAVGGLYLLGSGAPTLLGAGYVLWLSSEARQVRARRRGNDDPCAGST